MLYLTGNPLPIPLEILVKGSEPTTIINYYLEHHVKVTVADKKPLNEVKMLLVGQGSVGKTSLVRRLVEGTFNPRENKTEGIDINPWKVTVDGQGIQLNVWDFGGQEIMHATHQFFLTKRSLYLLVLDARIGEEENRVEYWLKIIQSFGGDSPIIVVGNKIDQQRLDIDQRGLQIKYPTIKAFVETSCKTGEGLEKLAIAIAQEIGTLEHIHDELLNTWFNVKTRLERTERNYISQEDYRQMCDEARITDPISQRTLLGFLHDLGIVLNFQGDSRLEVEETNILNPRWVTNGVYKILNARMVSDNKGVLQREMLTQILDPKKYPPEMHLFIIDIMRRFDLCFDFEGKTNQEILIPDLLPKEGPYTGEWDKALAFQYHYNVLPGSVFSRFITRMYTLIHNNTVWRTGVVLARDENKALVKADKEDGRVFIRIIGPEAGRRRFLAIIRTQFDAIHDTISRIEADEKVPLPDYPDIVVDYKHLLRLEMAGVDSYHPEGLTEIKVYSPKQLLDGVESEQERDKRREGLKGEDRPARQLTLSEPVETPEEAATEGERIKANLMQAAKNYAKRRFKIYFGLLAALLIVIEISILLFVPNPLTLMISSIVPIIGIYMGLILGRKKAINQISESRTKQLFLEAGLDWEEVEQQPR